MNIFDELDKLLGELQRELRRANLERRMAVSALQKIANGTQHPMEIAMEALISMDRVREELVKA